MLDVLRLDVTTYQNVPSKNNDIMHGQNEPRVKFWGGGGADRPIASHLGSAPGQWTYETKSVSKMNMFKIINPCRSTRSQKIKVFQENYYWFTLRPCNYSRCLIYTIEFHVYSKQLPVHIQNKTLHHISCILTLTKSKPPEIIY